MDFIKKIKNSKGYVAMEVILIASMSIAFGALAITFLRQSSYDITYDTINKVDNNVDDMHINTNFN